jgi:hypothetical protein
MTFSMTPIGCAIAFLAAATSGMATTTWDVVANFNAPNNPNASSVFSYGTGTPATFVAESNVGANCLGTPTYCETNGAAFPFTTGVLWNGTGGAVAANGSTILPSTQVYLDPQYTPGVILRFAAPFTSVYAVSGAFSALDSYHHTTDGYVYANGVLQQGPNALGGFGSTAAINLSGISLTAGQTIDFVVITGSDASYLATGLAGTITSPDGITVTPEPGTFALFAGAAIGIAGLLRLRRSRA